jgi:hypothetical protein
MPSAKFDELFQKTRKIESGPSNEEQLNVRFFFALPYSHSARIGLVLRKQADFSV